VTVTRTPRTGQTQWSSGSDPLRRVQLNGDADSAEELFALDDGVTYTALPTMGEILRGRYAMFSSGAGAYTTLYRATGDAGSWIPAMGNTMPDPVLHRPHAGGDHAATDIAETWTHPSLSNPGATLTYDGQARFTRVTAYDLDSAARGTIYAGLSPATAPDVATLGRVHVRTRQAGEKGLVVQAHDVTAGNLFTAREAGGSDVVTVDANGYLRARALAGFGGGAINAGAAVVVAPTSAAGDGVDVGLLLHGQSVATSKTILQVRRDLADTAPIVQVDRDNVALGRLPWGSGSAGGNITASGRQVNVRALGYDADPVLWRLWRASTATPENPGTDDIVAVLTRTTGSIRVPLTVSQPLNTGAAALVVQRYTDFNGRFMEFQRVTGGTEVIGALEADGRLSIGARWKGTGVMRDARQQMTHMSSAFIGGTWSPGQTATFEYPTMQLRSVTTTDLKIWMMQEATVNQGAFSDREDGQQWFLNIDISINGGGYSFLHSKLMGGPSHRTGTRPVSSDPATTFVKDVPAGATVKIRTRVFIGGAVPTVDLRGQWLTVEECVLADYPT
jgi:hypothetical protein